MNQRSSQAERVSKKNPQSRHQADEPWRDPVLGPCACSQLRRTSRAVSALYDGFLASAGLTVTQYGVLVTIARADVVTKTALAERLGMDRTTLTRNLQPLERGGLVREQTGADKREHQVALTQKGRRKLDAAYVCWKEAQGEFVRIFGDARLEDLNQLLKEASDSALRAGDKLTR
ncbi:MAG TPA: MarR family winged helix-turn-helix transcriptional regulator [Bryobacteraceae bacterium]|nr:MarR family winged helix-turn-helix transcriptional regulator [Bryobacteraceae bacterium]